MAHFLFHSISFPHFHTITLSSPSFGLSIVIQLFGTRMVTTNKFVNFVCVCLPIGGTTLFQNGVQCKLAGFQLHVHSFYVKPLILLNDWWLRLIKVKMGNLDLFCDSCHANTHVHTAHININSTIYLLNAKALYGVKVCTWVQLNCGFKMRQPKNATKIEWDKDAHSEHEIKCRTKRQTLFAKHCR